MFGLGFGEITIILFLALLFLGPKKLPELAKSLGKGIREFQKATRGLSEQIKDDSTKETLAQSASEESSTEEKA